MDDKERKDKILQRIRQLGSYPGVESILEGKEEGIPNHIYDVCDIMISCAEEIERIWHDKSIPESQKRTLMQRNVEEVKKAFAAFYAIKEGGGFNN